MPGEGVELVLPADAGVFRGRCSSASTSGGAPRRRGGVPHADDGRRTAATCSPPTRGCSAAQYNALLLMIVLPADAGVFRWPTSWT
ncbi:hypothetical protein [Streptomyces globisporus]|uniref:hypothetical protein n=1 Tax=Streptomyces globisporus TaxID=1908 RepID=UPI003F58D3D9